MVGFWTLGGRWMVLVAIALAVGTVAGTVAGTATGQMPGPHPIDPHPFPKPDLMSDDFTVADYTTVIFSPRLQLALKVTDHQHAIFSAMKDRYDFNFSNVLGMHGSATINSARIKHVLTITGGQIRDQLTVEQDKQLQGYFDKKILSPITVQSETSDVPVGGPHMVMVPGFGFQMVGSAILHYGSIEVNYTKFSATSAATQSGDAGSEMRAPLTEPAIATENLPPLESADEMSAMRQRRMQRMAALRGQSAPSDSDNGGAPNGGQGGMNRGGDSQTPPSSSQGTQLTNAQNPVSSGDGSDEAPRHRIRPQFQRPMDTQRVRVPVAMDVNAVATVTDDKLSDSLLATITMESAAKLYVVSHSFGGGFADQEGMEMPAKPGLLIGFEFGLAGNPFGGKVVQSVTSIFLTAAGEVRGHRFGKASETVVKIKAKNGYAVSGINIREGGNLDGLSVMFMKRDENALNPSDSYESQTLGNDLGERYQTLDGNGVPVVGIRAKVGDGALAIGLIFATGIGER